MMFKNKGYIILSLIVAVLLYYIFHPVINAPNQYLFGNESDGLKNYFTPLWYIIHDTGFHFTGMNYPYGENVFFTDNQPILSWILGFIHKHIIALDNHIIGIINLWIIFGIYLTTLYLYKLLRYFKMPIAYAIICAIIIGFLNPQWQRIAGHYALAYGFFMPAFIYYMLMSISPNSNTSYWVKLVIVIFFATLTHLYFLPLMGSLGLLFVGLTWLFDRHTRKKTFWTLLTIIGSFIVLAIIIRTSDSITDRPIHPYGQAIYTASPKSVFTPAFGSIQKFIGTKSGQAEGLAYVGMPALIFFILAFYYTLVLIKNGHLMTFIRNNKTSIILFISGWIILFYSFYWWHKIDYLHLFDHIPLLNQFRSLGRFAWGFYYVFTLLMAVFFWHTYHYLKSNGYKTQGIAFLGVVLSLWSIDAVINVRHETKSIFHVNKKFNSKQKDFLNLLTKNGHRPNEFQAILSLPLQNIGSEIIYVNRGHWTMNMVYKCAFETGLPVMDINMSRTSLSQSMDLVELLSNDIHPKARLSLMSEKPILLFWLDYKNPPNELLLQSKAKFIGSFEDYKLYSLPKSAFENNRINYRNIRSLDTISDHQYITQEVLNKDTIITKHFNDRQGLGFESEGGIEGSGLRFCFNLGEATSMHEVSFWKYINRDDKHIQGVFLQSYDEKDKLIRKRFDYNTLDNAHGSWVNMRFDLDPNIEKDYCIYTSLNCILDEAIIKPKGIDVLENIGGQKYFNGLKVK